MPITALEHVSMHVLRVLGQTVILLLHWLVQVFSLVPKPYQALHEMRRILKPGGALVFTVPFAAVS